MIRCVGKIAIEIARVAESKLRLDEDAVESFGAGRHGTLLRPEGDGHDETRKTSGKDMERIEPVAAEGQGGLLAPSGPRRCRAKATSDPQGS